MKTGKNVQNSNTLGISVMNFYMWLAENGALVWYLFIETLQPSWFPVQYVGTTYPAFL